MYALATLVVALLVLVACGAGQQNSTPAATAEPKPTAGNVAPAATAAPSPTPESAATAAAEGDLSLDSVTEGLALLSSYKSNYTIRFVGKDAQGQAIDNSIGVAEEFILEPRAQRIVSTSSKSVQGQVIESTRMEMVTIGQTFYISSQAADGKTSCTSLSSSDNTPPEQSLSPDTWGSVSDAKYVNTETVNGIRAKHYAWKEGSLVGFGWLSGKGETWVAVDGGYVVKQAIEGTGKGWLAADQTQEGTTTIVYEVTDANRSFEILPPEGCEGPATDIPIMPDALETMQSGEFLGYRSPTALADVVRFYKTEMPAKGWKVSGEPGETEGYSQLTYTKDTRQAVVVLTWESSAQQTTVFVTISKQ
jgi:hypothetical protein